MIKVEGDNSMIVTKGMKDKRIAKKVTRVLTKTHEKSKNTTNKQTKTRKKKARIKKSFHNSIHFL